MPQVDGTLADKDLFFLKVPAYLAESWKRKIRDSMLPERGADAQPSTSSGGQPLGWIMLDEQGQQHLDVNDPVEGSRLPKRYKLNELGQIMPQSHIGAELPGGSVRFEGRITQTLSAQPNLDGRAFDKRYIELTGDRDRQANTATAEIKLNTEQVRVFSMKSPRMITSVAKKRDQKRSLTKEEFEQQRSNIEAEIFTLFERVPNWTLAKLMKETGLAAVYLKEVLQKIAVLNKRGPYKDQWTIKKEFLENPDALQEPADGANPPAS